VQHAVKYSDNVAYKMLRSKIGDTNLYSYINSINAVFVNNFDCEEIAVYMKAVYEFSQTNGELGDEFLSFFINTEYEERIPAGTPELTVAHKIGFLPLEEIYHDAAVVWDEQPYILIIMTKGRANNNEDFFIKLSRLIQRRNQALFAGYAVEAEKPFQQNDNADLKPNDEEETASLVEIEKHQMSWTFSAYTEPNFKAERIADFSPQSVSILKKNAEGWALIRAYNGDYWVYLNDNLRFIDKTAMSTG
jgi:hypothetical protein